MSEIKRKILLTVLALALVLLATPFVGTVIAGKGQEKLYYEMNVTIFAYDFIDVRTAPPEGDPPNVVILTLLETYFEDFSLQIGSETFYPDRSAEVKGIIFMHQTIMVATVSETYTFDGVDGKIEIMLAGLTKDYGTPDAMSDMVVVGHGTGYFEGVKIKAEGHNELGNDAHKIHVGTIMGWPGLP